MTRRRDPHLAGRLVRVIASQVQGRDGEPPVRSWQPRSSSLPAPEVRGLVARLGAICCDKEVFAVGNFFKVVSAGPMFFVSAWVLMIFAGIVRTDVGIHPFGYVTSMVVTIGLWLTLAPAIGAVARVPIRKSKHR